MIYDNDKVFGIIGLYYFDEISDDKLFILLVFFFLLFVIGLLFNGGFGICDY